jgi:hypothetical protein
MVERAKSDPRISYILVWDSYRFYRERLRAAATKYDLQKHGVTVVYVTSKHDPDSDIAPVMDALYEALAEQESRKNRARTLNRQRDNCETRDPETGWCYKNGGLPPFGMKQVRVQRGWDTRRGVPIHKQLWERDDTLQGGKPRHAWVRVILLDWLTEQEWGYKRIMNELNRLGVKPVRNEYLVKGVPPRPAQRRQPPHLLWTLRMEQALRQMVRGKEETREARPVRMAHHQRRSPCHSDGRRGRPHPNGAASAGAQHALHSAPRARQSLRLVLRTGTLQGVWRELDRV